MSLKVSSWNIASSEAEKWPKLHSMAVKRRKDENFDDK